MTNASIKNATASVGSTLVSLLKSGEASKTGVFALIADHAEAIMQLAMRHETSKADENSTRAINLAFFADTPEGQDLMARKEAMKGERGNAEQKNEKALIKARENAINTFLTNACDAVNVITALRTEGFKVIVKRVMLNGKTTGKIACYVSGKEDDMPKDFTVGAIKSLAKCDVVNCTSYVQLDTLIKSSTSKAGKANKNKGNAGNAIAVSQLANFARDLDTTLAGLSLKPNEGTSPVSRVNLIRAAIRILDECDPAEVAKVRAEYDAEADNHKAAQSA